MIAAVIWHKPLCDGEASPTPSSESKYVKAEFLSKEKQNLST
jgi:hypothetical protein